MACVTPELEWGWGCAPRWFVRELRQGQAS